jgi:hypothetical protein
VYNASQADADARRARHAELAFIAVAPIPNLALRCMAVTPSKFCAAARACSIVRWHTPAFYTGNYWLYSRCAIATIAIAQRLSPAFPETSDDRSSAT